MLDEDPSSFSKEAQQPSPIFGPCLLWPKAGWLKTPLGTEIGMGPGGDTVLDGDPAAPTERDTAAPTFRPMSIVVKRLDVSGYHLVRRYASAQATLCYMRTQPPHGKGAMSILAKLWFLA